MEFLDADVPRVDGLRRAHDSSGGLIGDEDVGQLLVCNLLNNFIIEDRCFRLDTLERCDLLGPRNAGFRELNVELVQLTSFGSITEHARRQVEQLVLSLLAEVKKRGPFGLDLTRWFAKAAALETTLVQRSVTGLVRALNLLLLLLSLLGHLWALHALAERVFLFVALSNELALMHGGSLYAFVTAAIVTPVGILGLLLFHDVELLVFLRSDQVRVRRCSSLLLLLDNCLAWRDICSRLSDSEVAEFTEPLLLIIRLEQLSIELVPEVEVRASRAEALALEVDSKGVKVEIWAQKFLHLVCVCFSFSFKCLSRDTITGR